jgi:enamine deaminase RidA (YjgF/YER057c/UK114 family)
MAVASAPKRRVIELSNVRHNDPMSMAALTANLVTSSRVVTGQRVDDADEHTRLVFENVATIMELAKGDFRGITQVTAFVGGPEYRENIEKELDRRVGQGAGKPKVHLLEANLGGGGAPRLEILGIV